MLFKTCIFLIFVLACEIQYNAIYAKRILVISNVPSYSHQMSYSVLFLELNRRGHEIVSVTTHPIKNSSLTNYKEIDLSYIYQVSSEFKKLPYTEITEASMALPFTGVERFVWDAYYIMNREVFKHPEMINLYAPDSNEHFDAVIVAMTSGPSLNALAYRFNAPLIGIISQDTFNNQRNTFGSPILASHISNWQTNMEIESNMPFWKRLINFYEVWMQIYHWVNVNIPMEDALAKEYLGEHLPHIDDITRNMSIFFVNSHPITSFVRPEQPNIVFYNGFHIATVPPALPEDLNQTLDKAKNGFIYVSLGSNVKWEVLGSNIFISFLEAFSALPYKVIWKYPNPLPGKYNNILASKWLPQQSILAHPNIKLFIYQGGLQSTEEAIYYGVPLIAFPLLWDQNYRAQRMVDLGVCIRLQSDNISKENIENAVNKVIDDKSYKNRMERLSKLYKDVPYDSLENAVWWIEHVMRHNGTPHLRYSLCDQPWYQRYDWDIIGFFAILAFTILLISLYILYQILCFVYRYYYKILFSYSENDYNKSKTQ